MASKFRLSYHSRLFLLLLGFSWVLVVCFVGFQYNREKQYKVEKLDSQLQLYNAHLIDELNRGDENYQQILQSQVMPINDLRVSIIGKDGKLVFDNTLDKLPVENHLDRHEIAEAIKTGRGYTLRRHSTSTDKTYFYSATKGADVIVRSAVPYSFTLQEILDADRSFLWFMAVVTLIISIFGYFATRRIGRTISRLNLVAEKAEKGEQVYDVEAFPHDELGSISNHIVRLYARLQKTMTERDREHFRAMHEQQEKTRIKKQLTNNINHELKTPVASIKVCLETIREHPDLPKEKLWPFIEQSYLHTERLTNLLNDVSSITRLDDGAAHIEKIELDLREIIDEVVSGTKTDMNICVKVPESMPIVGNRMFLSSIFSNLINNAVAYSGGSEITISFDDESDNSYTLSVADNGCGIPTEHLERIFERFYRIDKGRSRPLGGTGLGLSIVRNAVQFHGGTIYATNLPAGGLKFTFSLAK